MKTKNFITVCFMLLTLAVSGWAQGESDLSATQSLATLPVQSGGRLKPLDTLARESVRLVTGKVQFEKQEPVVTLLSWWADPELEKREIIEFRDLEAKKELGLDPDQRWYSFAELAENQSLDKWRQEIHQHQQNDEELHGPEEKIQDLLIKMSVVGRIKNGSIFQVVPNPSGMEETWGSFADFEHEGLIELVIPAKNAVDQLRQAIVSGDEAAILAAAGSVRSELSKLGPVPEETIMARELRYNKSHPFRKAWILYLVGLAILTFSQPKTQTMAYRAGCGFILAGFVMHIYGFALRCLIAGRPPVTNMYESVIWVAFGAVLFALIFEYISPRRYYLMSAAAGAVVCLVLADTLPTVLDPSINPLTPVLRSNFWLTIHVLSITLGYAAFLLALGLGHMVLWKSALRPQQEEVIAGLHDALYRALQVGVLLLAAGTILGGVWANYSWGRFWGWDPKEVWALIALLGYLAILHGRHAGWIRKFGIAAWSVIAFQGVLMAWYGVNYVLGAGLHSYGFGSGGVEYVGVYVVAEILFVLWATHKHRSHLRPVEAKQ
ncbi:MAG: cytochrome c biogenesis protein CcsA [Vulcanimicrobiota bacterium]